MTSPVTVIIVGLIVVGIGLLYLIDRNHTRRPRRRRKPVVGGLLDRAKLRPAVHKTRVVPASKVPELRPVPDPDFPNPGRYEKRGAKPRTSQAVRLRNAEAGRAMLLELAEQKGYGSEARDLLEDLDVELGVEHFSMDEYRQHRAEEL